MLPFDKTQNVNKFIIIALFIIAIMVSSFKDDKINQSHSLDPGVPEPVINRFRD